MRVKLVNNLPMDLKSISIMISSVSMSEIIKGIMFQSGFTNTRR